MSGSLSLFALRFSQETVALLCSAWCFVFLLLLTLWSPKAFAWCTWVFLQQAHHGSFRMLWTVSAKRLLWSGRQDLNVTPEKRMDFSDDWVDSGVEPWSLQNPVSSWKNWSWPPRQRISRMGRGVPERSEPQCIGLGRKSRQVLGGWIQARDFDAGCCRYLRCLSLLARCIYAFLASSIWVVFFCNWGFTPAGAGQLWQRLGSNILCVKACCSLFHGNVEH